jgi:hypothetical protein
MTTSEELKSIAHKLFNIGKHDIINILNKTSTTEFIDYNDIATNIYKWYHDKQETIQKIYKQKIIKYISNLIQNYDLENKKKHNHVYNYIRQYDNNEINEINELNTSDLIKSFNQWDLYQKQDISMEIIDDEKQYDNNQLDTYLHYKEYTIKSYPHLLNIINEYEYFVQQYYIINHQQKQLELFPINSLKNLIYMLSEKHNEIIYKLLMLSCFTYIDFNVNSTLSIKPIIGYNDINEPTLIYIFDLHQNLSETHIDEIISHNDIYAIPKIMIIKFDDINKSSLINYLESFISFIEKQINFTILDKNNIYELLYQNEINLQI